MMELKQCFPPVVDKCTRLLVLGSLPGEKSLAQSQYYAHKQNRFWNLMGQVLEVDLVAMAYEDRLAALLQKRVGLWDVVAEAQRDGSLDSQIREHRGNDLPGLLAALPDLRGIAFNGGTAAKLGRKSLGTLAQSYELIDLPSSSPAFTLSATKKVEAWLPLRGVLAA